MAQNRQAEATQEGASGSKAATKAAGRVRIGKGAEIQLSAAAAGRCRGGAEMVRGASAVACRCGCWLQRDGPSAPTGPSLSLQLCVERGMEKVREASLIPLFVLSPSPSHTSPRPPQYSNSRPPLRSPHPTFSTLYTASLYDPPLPSLLPLHLHPSLRLFDIFIA